MILLLCQGCNGNLLDGAFLLHCKPGQVEPAYIECGNGAAAMQVSQVNLFELGPS